MEHESDGDTIYNWCSQNNLQTLVKGTLIVNFNRPSGFWPCVKSCLVGGSDKYRLLKELEKLEIKE